MSNAGTYGIVTTDRGGTAATGAFGLGPRGRGDDSAAETDKNDAAIEAMKNVFGPDLRVNMAMSNVAPGYKSSRAHATTGIPLAIAGSATVVNIDVTEKLSAFSDPIKAILGTGIEEGQKIIIKRQYVAGGGADIVPERAPARTVAVQEDVREGQYAHHHRPRPPRAVHSRLRWFGSLHSDADAVRRRH